MSNNPVQQIDPTACPFCGGNNVCAMSGDNGGATAPSRCWCFQQEVPKELRDSVPPELKRQACICQACVLDYLNDPEGFRRRFKLSEK